MPTTNVQTRDSGNYRKIKDISEIQEKDFSNPWNFFNLMLNHTDIIKWLQDRNLLACSPECSTCKNGTLCKLRKRKKHQDGVSFRCRVNQNHEFSVRLNSFFFGSHFKIQDILLFVKNIIDGNTLHRASCEAGLSYTNTAVTWVKNCRQIFQQ